MLYLKIEDDTNCFVGLQCPLAQMIADIEKDLITRALADTGGNKSRAAIWLGLNRTTLIEKMRKYQMPLLPANPRRAKAGVA